MRKIIVSVITMYLLCTSCRHKTIFKEVQSGNLFSLKIPTYMHAANDMFPGIAALQYESDSAQVYLLVFDTSRKGLNETTLKMYYDSAVSQPSLQNATIALPELRMINGDSAYTTEMTGQLNGTNVFYRIETIATRSHFYDILMWGKAEKEADLKDDMNETLNSFYDINKSK